MGIVINQSIKNTIITYIGFVIGAANTLYMYPRFLGDTYYGLTGFLLSTANLLMPLMAFGVHNTVIKFFTGYNTEQEKSRFLSFVLLLPLILIVPFMLLGALFYAPIANFLSEENPIIYNYVWQLPVIGLAMAYFEIFYAWVKVNLKSVFGNFIKEVVLRVFVTIGLFAVYLRLISPADFINLLMVIYLLATLIMLVYAVKVRRFKFGLTFPADKGSIFLYSLFIILSGSIANALLELDKTMLAKYMPIETIAYYSVAIFVATVIAVPGRAMHQITAPITARMMNEDRHDELNALYKNTSITLQVVGGFVFVCILVNINMLYEMMPDQYRGGIFVVFTIGLSKYFDLMLGNNNAIIFNSKYYRAVLFLGILLAIMAVSLNMLFIPLYGIDGAALSTLISITIYSISKLMFVVFKMKLFPFSRNTIGALVLLILTFVTFFYWDFPFHPIVNMVLKTALVVPFFIILHYRFVISIELNQVMKRLLGRFHISLK